MTKFAFLLVGNDAAFRAVARSAAKLVDAESMIEEPASLDEAGQRPAGGDRLMLVMDRPSSDEVTRALAATDDDGLPRWAAAFTGAPPGAASCAAFVPDGDQNDAAAMARLFSAAIERHRLRRENLRLRGDLKTIGRRINHDIRTQLGGIVSTADLLRDVLPAEDSEPHRLVQSVVDSVGEVLTLLERVKVMVMTGGEVSSMEETLAGDVAMAEGQRLKERLLARGATLTQPHSWPPVTGVHSWLKAVWWNLLTNALEHGGEGVRIETGWHEEGEGEFRFWVSDNGPGVPAAAQAALFPPFHSLHEVTAGHGLGLAIVRRLTKHMGGRCGFDPSPSGGACFWFTLPAHAPANRNAGGEN